MNKINNNISLNDAIKIVDIDNLIFKRRENNFLLNDFQISVLQRNGINYLKYYNMKDMLFDIEDILNDYYDDELDMISTQLAEIIYYNDTNK